MLNADKKLIKELFLRLEKVKQENTQVDSEAYKLIQKMVKCNPNLEYYMVQTILAQEEVIKDLRERITYFKRKALFYKNNSLADESLNGNPPVNQHQKKSFFEKSHNLKDKESDQNYRTDSFQKEESKKQEGRSFNNTSVNQVEKNHSSSFLRSALQTATGVAGGILASNVISNVFNAVNSRFFNNHTLKNGSSIESNQLSDEYQPIEDSHHDRIINNYFIEREEDNNESENSKIMHSENNESNQDDFQFRENENKELFNYGEDRNFQDNDEYEINDSVEEYGNDDSEDYDY